jgi:hypothetical protein
MMMMMMMIVGVKREWKGWSNEEAIDEEEQQ